jgi:hypothetical protein
VRYYCLELLVLCSAFDSSTLRQARLLEESEKDHKHRYLQQKYRMLGARLSKQVISRVGVRSASSLPTMLSRNVWRKSNVLYITYIAAGCVVLGSVYGGFFNTVWESNNRGVIFPVAYFKP